MAIMSGLSVLAFVALVWAVVGLTLLQVKPVTFAGPVILSALAYAAARRPARNLTPRTEEETRIGKLIGF